MQSKRDWLLGACLSVFTGIAAAALPIQHWKTPRGAHVYFIENHDLPMLDISVTFPAGSAWDVPRQAGLAYLTRRLLPLGAGGVSEAKIADRLADVGAVLNGRFDRDRAGLALRTLSGARVRGQALGVLADILQRPDFPAAVVAREKQRVIAAIEEVSTQPAYLARRAFFAALYGNQGYGLPRRGTTDTVARLTRMDVQTFYRRHYRVDRAVVALVGDMSRQQAEAVARRLTAALPAPAAERLRLPPPATPAGPRSRFIANPAKQSHILVGALGIRRGDPDYFPLLVGNYLLGGGGFASRLMREIREKRGLAYSVSSYFEPLQRPGPFVIGLQTQKAQTSQALTLVRQTVADFVAQGPTPAEVARAKRHLRLGFPLRIDTNRKLLEYLSLIGYYRLPLNYLDDFTRQVGKVNAAAIRNAFIRHVHPRTLVTVVVGARSGAPAAAVSP